MAPPQPGDRLPLDLNVWVLSPEDPDNPGKARQPVAVTLAEVLKGKRRCILVGIPGPFTPGACGRKLVLVLREAALRRRPDWVNLIYLVHGQKSFDDDRLTPFDTRHLSGCSRSHVPGFVEAHHELRAKGIDQVFVVSTADGE